jgi:uncharacterized protein YjiS (DUF1127 family)
MTFTFAATLTFFKTALFRPRQFSQYQAAYRNYLKFKELTDEEMRDMGVTQADVDRATLADFLTPTYR